MKRLFFVASFLYICVGPVVAQEAKSPASNVLDDVVIKTSVEAEYEEEKPPMHLRLDYSKALALDELFQWQEESDWFPRPPGLNSDLDLRLSNTGAAQIVPAPVKIFKTNFKQLRQWHLVVRASGGEVYRKIDGKGSPPAEIEWDGLSDSGQPILPGTRYVYDFTAIDKAGNKRTFPGDPFSVSSYYFFNDGKLVIGVSNSELLASDGFHLLPQAREVAQEVAALIRFYVSEGLVSVRSMNSNLEPFVGMVAHELAVDRAFLQNSSGPLTGEKGIMFYAR